MRLGLVFRGPRKEVSRMLDETKNAEKRGTPKGSVDAVPQAKKIYERPLFEEEKGMKFPEEIWEEFNGGNWCFGCSNCNCN